ncbi:hypothetical protein BSKO_12997 [Bryopsis sp. KO-2023]|nr:hypothetical protein BSKO_12997 [Bryopsis sp. KO-2023]
MARWQDWLVTVCLLLIGRAICDDGVTLESFKKEKSAHSERFAKDAARHVINKASSRGFECECAHHECGDEFDIDSECVDIGESTENHTCDVRDGCASVKLHLEHSFLMSTPEQKLDFSTKDDMEQALVNEICLFKSLDQTRIFMEASEFEKKGFNGWSYIGTPSGMLMTFPGRARNRFGSDTHGATCEPYDATLRPWFGPAMSARKAVVILAHSSATDQAKKIVAKVLTTLTYSDYVSVLVCDSGPEHSIVHCVDGVEESGKRRCLERGTQENVRKMKDLLDEGSVASLVPAFHHAFDLLESVASEGVDKMILFMAGDTFSPETTEDVLQAVGGRQKPNDKVNVLGYSFNSDDGLARQLACENHGVSMNIDASADMTPYFSFISLAPEHAEKDPSYVHFTPSYVDAGHLGLVITTSMAMYEEFDCNSSWMGQKRRFLGVAGIDKQVQVLEKAGLKDDYEKDLGNIERSLSIWDVKGLDCQLQILRKRMGSECAVKMDHSQKCLQMGKDQYYFIPPEKWATFEAAQEKCAKIGGRIVNLDSAQERALLASVVPRSGVWVQLERDDAVGGIGGDNSWANGGHGKGECAKIDPRGRTNNVVLQDCDMTLPYMCEFDRRPKECKDSVLDLIAAAGDLDDAEKCEKKNECKAPAPAQIKAPQGGPLCNWPPYSSNYTIENEKGRVCCSAEEYDKACPLRNDAALQEPIILVFGAAFVLLLILLIGGLFVIRRWIARPPQPIPIASNILKMGERLGGGYSGEVYRATWMEERVAVKIFHYPERQDAKSELVIFRTLPQHPNIIRCIGIRDGNEEGTVALILELMEMNLEDFISGPARHRGISYRELFQVFFDVACGLDHLHHHNFLHLDLKPRNVLISLEGAEDSPTVKLCDFGLSIECMTNSINLAGTRGTPGYIAPETQRVSLNSVVKATRKADIFSLGMIMRACLISEPDASSELRGSRETLDGIMPLVESCTRWDPTQRPSAREVCTALNNLMKKDWANRGVFGGPSVEDSESGDTADNSEVHVRTLFSNPPPQMWLGSSEPSVADPDTIYIDADSHSLKEINAANLSFADEK